MIEHAPGPETSGTAFFTYGLLWGMNNGFLDKATYQPVVEKSLEILDYCCFAAGWTHRLCAAYRCEGHSGQVVDANSTANFDGRSSYWRLAKWYNILELDYSISSQKIQNGVCRHWQAPFCSLTWAKRCFLME